MPANNKIKVDSPSVSSINYRTLEMQDRFPEYSTGSTNSVDNQASPLSKWTDDRTIGGEPSDRVYTGQVRSINTDNPVCVKTGTTCFNELLVPVSDPGEGMRRSETARTDAVINSIGLRPRHEQPY